MPRFHRALSRLAEKDLAAIAKFTLETWGEAQLEKYRALLNRAFSELTRNPSLARMKSRPELFPDCRSLHVGRHIILYRVKGDAVEVARVLHDSMELDRHVIEFPDIQGDHE